MIREKIYPARERVPVTTDDRRVTDTDLPAAVQRVLEHFLQRAGGGLTERVEPFAEAVAALRAFVLNGGKRLRPTFAWWGWRAAGGEAGGAKAAGALHVAASLELIQACALIHDDLMDASAIRRGAPTVHVAFATKHEQEGWIGTPEGFGLSAAVLIGDLALVWADDMFASADLPASALEAARPVWRAMRTEVLAGQYLDVHTQATGDASPEAALRVSELKTAAYTVARPLELGARLAGADDELTAALRSFGTDIGVAFQLRDDLLGVFGDPDVTGKPAGDDLREGKRTLLVALGIERAREQGRSGEERAIAHAVGNAELTEEAVQAARRALVDVGAVDAVEQRITELTERALATLRRADIDEPAASELIKLAHAATQRRK